MTLIINCFTPNFVIQVSDRRLTSTWPDGTIKIVDGKANKATFFLEDTVFGYTGLARINGKSTEEWLLEALGNHTREPLLRVLENVGTDATSAFRRIGYSRAIKRLAFIGIGWTLLGEDNGEDQKPVPIEYLVSNFHETQDSRTIVLPAALDKFNVLYRIFTPLTSALWTFYGAKYLIQFSVTFGSREISGVPEANGLGAVCQSIHYLGFGT